MTDTPNAAVAALASQLIADQQEREALFQAWLQGTATGGPDGDGRYPLPSPTGTIMVPCFALLTDPLIGAAAEARQDALGAAESADTASRALTSTGLLKGSVEEIGRAHV